MKKIFDLICASFIVKVSLVVMSLSIKLFFYITYSNIASFDNILFACITMLPQIFILLIGYVFYQWSDSFSLKLRELVACFSSLSLLLMYLNLLIMLASIKANDGPVTLGLYINTIFEVGIIIFVFIVSASYFYFKSRRALS